MTREKKIVLHITEAFGGGIQSALESYAIASQDLPLVHHLLARSRSKDDIGVNTQKLFEKTEVSHANLLAFFMQMRKTITELQPDFIHLHSSFAGFLGRYLPEGDHRIVYTPHCYSFERQDISARMKMVYLWLEGWRLDKVDVVAGCSERECALAYSLGAKQTVHLNNYAKVTFSPDIAPKDAPPFNVFIVGRLSMQKDPLFLIKTIRELKKHSEYKSLRFFWLGGGNEKYSRILEKHGVKVSGMLSRQKTLKSLQQAHLYLHTAAWEGMPLTLLEAAKLHVPTIVRFSGAMQGISYPYIAQSPKAMAQQIRRFVRDPYNEDYLMHLQLFNQKFSEENQRVAIKELYGVA